MCSLWLLLLSVGFLAVPSLSQTQAPLRTISRSNGPPVQAFFGDRGYLPNITFSNPPFPKDRLPGGVISNLFADRWPYGGMIAKSDNFYFIDNCRVRVIVHSSPANSYQVDTIIGDPDGACADTVEGLVSSSRMPPILSLAISDDETRLFFSVAGTGAELLEYRNGVLRVLLTRADVFSSPPMGYAVFTDLLYVAPSSLVFGMMHSYYVQTLAVFCLRVLDLTLLTVSDALGNCDELAAFVPGTGIAARFPGSPATFAQRSTGEFWMSARGNSQGNLYLHRVTVTAGPTFAVTDKSYLLNFGGREECMLDRSAVFTASISMVFDPNPVPPNSLFTLHIFTATTSQDGYRCCYITVDGGSDSVNYWYAWNATESASVGETMPDQVLTDTMRLGLVRGVSYDLRTSRVVLLEQIGGNRPYTLIRAIDTFASEIQTMGGIPQPSQSSLISPYHIARYGNGFLISNGDNTVFADVSAPTTQPVPLTQFHQAADSHPCVFRSTPPTYPCCDYAFFQWRAQGLYAHAQCRFGPVTVVDGVAIDVGYFSYSVGSRAAYGPDISSVVQEEITGNWYVLMAGYVAQDVAAQQLVRYELVNMATNLVFTTVLTGTSASINRGYNCFPNSLVSECLLRERAAIAVDSADRTIYFTIVNDWGGTGISYFNENDALATARIQELVPLNPFPGSYGLDNTMVGNSVYAQLNKPMALALDTYTRDLYIADTYSHRIRVIKYNVVKSQSIIYTYAGTGALGAVGTDTPMDSALMASSFYYPIGLYLDPQLRLMYITDLGLPAPLSGLVPTAIDPVTVTTTTSTADSANPQAVRFMFTLLPIFCQEGGTYSANGVEPCLACTVCGDGQMEAVACTTKINTQCVAAPAAAGSSGLSGGEVAGIVIPVLLVAAGIAGFAMWRWRALKRRSEQAVQITHDAVKDGDKKGEGNSGIVYKAIWRGTEVAHKVLKRQEETEENLRLFESECAINLQIGNHPRVCLFLGYCPEKDHRSFVFAYMPYGSLDDLLYDYDHRKTQAPRLLVNASVSPGELIRNLRTLSQILVDCSAAIMHCHARRVIHCDIAARNFLVTDQMRGTVCDFGLSQVLKEGGGTRVKLPPNASLPLRWCAPEMLRKDGHVSFQTDVYAFGMMMYECVQRGVPYKGMGDEEVARTVVQGDKAQYPLKPMLPASCPKEWAKLINDCADFDPKLRPTMSVVNERLTAFLNECDAIKEDGTRVYEVYRPLRKQKETELAEEAKQQAGNSYGQYVQVSNFYEPFDADESVDAKDIPNVATA